MGIKTPQIIFDGYFLHRKPIGIKKDRQRDKELLQVGWKTIRFGYKDLKNPEMIISQIRNFCR